MTGIKSVLLDVNGTLYSIREALQPVFKELGLDPSLTDVCSAEWHCIGPEYE